jgi:hypothetical protein
MESIGFMTFTSLLERPGIRVTCVQTICGLNGPFYPTSRGSPVSTFGRSMPVDDKPAVSDPRGTAGLGWLIFYKLARATPRLTLQGKEVWRISLTRVGELHGTPRC